MVGGDGHAGLVAGHDGGGAAEGIGFCAFDIHLDEVDAGEGEILGEAVDGGEGDLDGAGGGFALHDEGVGCAILGVDEEFEGILLVPDAFGDEDEAAVTDLGGKIAAEAFEVFGGGFDGDDLAGAGVQGEAGERADIGAASEDGSAGLDVVCAGAVELGFHLGEVEGEDVFLAGGDPEGAVGGLPEFKAGGVGFEEAGSGEDAVFGGGQRGLFPRDADGVRRGAALALADEGDEAGAEFGQGGGNGGGEGDGAEDQLQLHAD